MGMMRMSMELPPNADRGELSKFDALAHRFWDPRGEFRPLHLLNPVRLGFIAEHAILAGARALDVGCGGGLLSEALSRKGARVTGIDLAPGMIEVARLHAAEEGLDIDYRVAAAEDLAAALGESADIVTCMEMLEHVPHPAADARDAGRARAARRLGVRLDAQPQSQVLPAGDRGRRVRAQAPAARHARIRAAHTPF